MAKPASEDGDVQTPPQVSTRTARWISPALLLTAMAAVGLVAKLMESISEGGSFRFDSALLARSAESPLPQIEHQSERVTDVTSRNKRILPLNPAAGLQQRVFRYIDILNHHLQNWAKRSISINKQSKCPCFEASHLWIILEERKTQHFGIEGFSLFGPVGLDNDISRAFRHCHLSCAMR